MAMDPIRRTEQDACESLVGDVDPFFYLCGRLLPASKLVVLPVFSAAVAGIWSLKERILVREEEPGLYIFMFKDKEERDRVLGGGPWYYGGAMVVLAEYDGLSPLEEISLNQMEVWISVTGLQMAMRNARTLMRIGNDLGTFIRPDVKAVQRKEKVQRVRVLVDVRQRIPAGRVFEFSKDISVHLEFKLEKCHGICKACGLFGHGGSACDGGLKIPSAEEMAEVSVQRPGKELVPSEEDRTAELGVAGPSVFSPPGVIFGKIVASEHSLEVSELVASPGGDWVISPPISSAGNPNSKGLTGLNGLTGPNGDVGLGAVGGPQAGFGLKRKKGSGLVVDFDEGGPSGPVVGKRKKKQLGGSSSAAMEPLETAEGIRVQGYTPRLVVPLGKLVDVPVELGYIPKKRGRPRKQAKSSVNEVRYEMPLLLEAAKPLPEEGGAAVSTFDVVVVSPDPKGKGKA